MTPRATYRLLLLTALLASAPAAAGFTQRSEVQGFIDEMVREHAFDREPLVRLMDDARTRDDILAAISRPAEAKPWRDYRPIFVTEDRIRGGVAFWRQHADALAAAEREFGVAPHIIVAIIGVETRYGKHTGRYRVLDALATLAFDYPPRSEFFRGQLSQYLIMAREEGIDPRELTGSYAGAMGQPQFMPSSFRNFAVDFDGDGRRDLWRNPVDVIGSVANYFHMHGWRAGESVAHPIARGDARLDSVVNTTLAPDTAAWALSDLDLQVPGLAPTEKVSVVKLDGENGAEYWLARHNYYVITRYNRSLLYAMAVHQLGEAIREAMEGGPRRASAEKR
ncbi:MAG: lytic murein transglycosylase B [Thiohalomonadaceae bacterium]